MSNDLLEVDELSLYFGDPYVVNQYITITLPTIGELVQFGEKEYFGVVQTLTTIPSEAKSQLWDMGIDWNKITDYQMFTMLAPTLPQSQTSILFGDLDFQALRLYDNPQSGGVYLKDPESGVIIDELAYGKIQAFLCKAHNLTKKVQHAANEMTRKVLIEEDRRNRAYAAKKGYKSFLRPIISAVKCRMGYDLNYIKNMGLVELMDDVARLQIIVQTDALLHGSYSGMIDTSKIKKSEFDWLRDITK